MNNDEERDCQRNCRSCFWPGAEKEPSRTKGDGPRIPDIDESDTKYAKDPATMMKEGAEFTGYFQKLDQPNSIVGIPIFVFYEQDGKLGTLYWCKVGERVKNLDECLPLHTITDMYGGKQTRILRTTKARMNCCVAIISKTATLNLEAKSASQRDAWLFGIHEILTTSGVAATETRPNTTKDSLKTQVETTVPGDIYRKMINGGAFRGFFPVEGDESNVEARNIFIFYSADMGKSGSLYWCDHPGEVYKSSQDYIPLHEVTGMYVGKQTAVLKHPICAESPSRRCFSILSDDVTLNLEAKSNETRRAWLKGINGILIASGKKQVVETVNGRKNTTNPTNTSSVSSASASNGRTTPESSPNPTAVMSNHRINGDQRG